MKIRKIYVAIALTVLTTSFPSASSAMTKEEPPATNERNQLMSQGEMSHKMMLFKEAFPKEGKDIVHGEIGPTLHAVNVKTFRCPTVEELQHVVLKKTGVTLFPAVMEFESNGIYFTTTELPPANAKFYSIEVDFKGLEKEITQIRCRYEVDRGGFQTSYPVEVNLNKSPLKESKVTFSQNDMKLGEMFEREGGGGKIVFKKNIEFTVQPSIKK